MRVEVRQPKTREEFAASLRALRPGATDRVELVLVTGPKAPWSADWVDDAVRCKAVREGAARVVFVGTTAHAAEWARKRPKDRPGVRLEALQPWAPTAVDDLAGRENLPYEDMLEALVGGLGGCNRAVRRALRTSGPRARSMAQVSREAEQATRELAKREHLDIPLDLAPVFDGIARYCLREGDQQITPYEVREGVFADVAAPVGLDEHAVVRIGVLSGIIEPAPYPEGVAPEHRYYRMNPMAAAALAGSE